MQEPERYLAPLKLVLFDPIDPKRPAVIDSAHRLVVNHEIYYFATPESLARFEKDPLPWCGLLTDPVSGRRFTATKSSPTTTWKGRTFYFDTKASAAKFETDPDVYRYPRRTMPPRM